VFELSTFTDSSKAGKQQGARDRLGRVAGMLIEISKTIKPSENVETARAARTERGRASQWKNRLKTNTKKKKKKNQKQKKKKKKKKTKQ